MKSFNKSLIAVAIATAPFTANALEALDDEFLSDVSGQEGITIEDNLWNTIEEFRYVDGDGDGSVDSSGNPIAGSIAMTNITVGNFVDETGSLIPLSGIKTVTEIDAAANGVLITTKQVGEDAPSVNALGFADGQDISIGGIHLGGTDASGNASFNSIGTVTMANASSWFSAEGAAKLQSFGVTSGVASAADSHVVKQTLISSKEDGSTGVHIVQEGGGIIESITYTDGAVNDGTNSISIVGLAQFRTADTDDIDSVSGSYKTGNYLRGTRSEFDLDVEGGAVVLSNQVNDSSTVIGGIIIGTQSIGSLAILGSHSEGTTKISAH